MDTDKNKHQKTDADDNVSNNARYSKSGEVTREDDRDRKDSMDDWHAEKSRTGRHK